MNERKKIPGRVRICPDPYPSNPRTEYDNISVMICKHKRYELGDKGPSDEMESDDYPGWDEFEEALIEKYKPIAIEPLYMYDHSGITISTSPFSCRWDSGQVGFVLVPDSARKEYPGKTEEEVKAWAQRMINGDVKVYDQFLTGDVYGFVVDEAVEDPTRPGEQMIDCDEEPVFDKNAGDSCWGFYGSDWKTNGMADDLQELVDAGYTIVTD